MRGACRDINCWGFCYCYSFSFVISIIYWHLSEHLGIWQCLFYLILECSSCTLFRDDFLLTCCNFFQLIECPSIYELAGCSNFHWSHIPLLEIWREKLDNDGNSHIILESYPPAESIEIFKEALSANTVSYELLLCQVQIINVWDNFKQDCFTFSRFCWKWNGVIMFGFWSNVTIFKILIFAICYILWDPYS